MKAWFHSLPQPRPAVPTGPALRPMVHADLDAVMAIETEAYRFPWSRGNFIDSLAAGHLTGIVEHADRLLGYYLALAGVDEMHLLNVTVAPHAQRRGHARNMLADLARHGRRCGAAQLWLEVRADNVVAQAAYRRIGFVQMGMRKGYYPALDGRREDALVMSLQLDSSSPQGAA